MLDIKWTYPTFCIKVTTYDFWLRIKTNANLGGAKIRVIVDVGFGDAIEPGIVELELPVA